MKSGGWIFLKSSIFLKNNYVSFHSQYWKSLFTSWWSRWSSSENCRCSSKIFCGYHIYWNVLTILLSAMAGWQKILYSGSSKTAFKPISKKIVAKILRCISATLTSHFICLHVILKHRYIFCRAQDLLREKKNVVWCYLPKFFNSLYCLYSIVRPFYTFSYFYIIYRCTF